MSEDDRKFIEQWAIDFKEQIRLMNEMLNSMPMEKGPEKERR